MFDLLIIGAGINGAGVARDAAGRGLKVALVDQGDLGGATSGASTKLIHGGLRYLETYELRLVAKALAEREVLIRIAPHIAWPLAFVLPHVPALRPRWMIRAGLFLYDHLARRREVPGSSAIDLRHDLAGAALKPAYTWGFRYWDGWIDDARLVVLNARDAADRGAEVILRDGVAGAERTNHGWRVSLASGRLIEARTIVNAGGPWAEDIARRVLGLNDAPRLKLVQGAHLVTRRVNPTEDAFILQGPDRRIVFVIPYEREFSLIGTTERPIGSPMDAGATEEEQAYLLDAANRYLARPLTDADVVRRFAGVRPLVDEPGVSARETTRDWRLVSNAGGAAMTIVGGKLTTYRLLAEAVLDALAPGTRRWTAGAPLPGGDIDREPGESAVAAFARRSAALVDAHPEVAPQMVRRIARIHGTGAGAILAAPGANLGDVFEAELAHFAEREWATCADDVLWRRTKLGLTLGSDARARVVDWFATRASDTRARRAGSFVD